MTRDLRLAGYEFVLVFFVAVIGSGCPCFCEGYMVLGVDLDVHEVRGCLHATRCAGRV